MKPTLGLVIGDPAGVGPELAAKLLALLETAEQANIVVLGDQRILQKGAEIAGVELAVNVIQSPADIDFGGAMNGTPLGGNPLLLDLPAPEALAAPLGQVSAACGRAVLTNYTTALRLANDDVLAGFSFTPFNKGSLKLAGNPCEDELQFAAQELGHTKPVSEFNVLENMWNARVTSHVPLKDVAGLLSVERIVTSIRLAHEALKTAGFAQPRIAVAALNPHAGDNGNIGREEIDIIAPAVAQAQALQIHADGPFPGDTLYLRIRDGQYHCAVTMYHDQGQTAIKLLGFDKGVTFLGGLPFPITTPAHGTAFDIAGQGKANPEGTRRAFAMLCRMTTK